MKSSYISLADSVRMRREHFGGVFFDKDTGAVIDVDREAYELLSVIKEKGIADINDLKKAQFRHCANEADKIIQTLIQIGIVKLMPPGLLNEDCYRRLHDMDKQGQKINWPSHQDISAPDTAHWAVTFRCDATCPDCYMQRHKSKYTDELDTEEALKLIDKIAAAGIFQLALGGGEPFLRQDLGDLVERAYEKGMVVHVTTGRYGHEDGVLRKIAKHIKNMQIGIKHQELVANPEKQKVKLVGLVNVLGEMDVDAGANLILSHSVICNFERIIEVLSGAGFKRITLLRYKPPAGVSQWMKEKPDEESLLQFAQQLLWTMDVYPRIKFRVDCGLGFLQRNLAPQTALFSGIGGCVAAARIMSIGPDGSVFPCSQLVGDKFYAGNLHKEDLNSIWLESKVLRKYCNFRHSKSFKNGKCGKCMAKIHCGGCRVFAEDALGADAGCPQSIPVPPKCKKRGSSKLVESYDALSDIQESIGFTSGGFPYATLEEIRQWLDEADYRDYPKWLLEDNAAGDKTNL